MLLCSSQSWLQGQFRTTSFVSHNCATWDNIMLLSPDTLESTESLGVVLGLSAWTLHTAISILPLPYYAGHTGKSANPTASWDMPKKEGTVQTHSWILLPSCPSPSQVMGEMAGYKPCPRTHQDLNSTLLFLPSFPLGLDKSTLTDHLV